MDGEGAAPCQLASVPECGPGQIQFTRKHIAQGTDVPGIRSKRREGVSR